MGNKTWICFWRPWFSCKTVRYCENTMFPIFCVSDVLLRQIYPYLGCIEIFSSSIIVGKWKIVSNEVACESRHEFRSLGPFSQNFIVDISTRKGIASNLGSNIVLHLQMIGRERILAELVVNTLSLDQKYQNHNFFTLRYVFQESSHTSSLLEPRVSWNGQYVWSGRNAIDCRH